MDEVILRDCCKEVDIYSEDSFVGIRSVKGKLEVVFPIGYKIGDDNDMVRKDIITLMKTISVFSKKTETDIENQRKIEKTDFPFFSYIYLVRDYLTNGLYVEKEHSYSVAKRGKINWSRTIKTQRAYPTNDSLVYLNYVVSNEKINQNELITLVYEACVYKSFIRAGWIYTSFIPPKPRLKFDKNLFKSVVNQNLATTFSDKKKELFNHLLNVINEESNVDTDNDYSYGTTRFEYVWENMIDYMFGIGNKQDYFPHSQWNFQDNSKENCALEPDTIMIRDGVAYILDAKYYRYGVTKISNHLPSTSSIAKQIIYAEYIEKNKLCDNKGNQLKTYNAFIMPFSKKGKYFKTDSNYKYIGYADANWKGFENDYEHVEGILLDINYIMENCSRLSEEDISELATVIKDSFE